MTVAADKAYRVLRARIISGEYSPGARLKEREICADLDVSRTPIREALRRLEADGLVHIEPHRGGVVTEIGTEEAAEIFSLGAVMESYAARLAATRDNPEATAELDRLLEDMAGVLERQDTDAHADYMRLDSELHATIVEMASSRRLTAALQQVVGVPVLVQAFNRYSMDDLWQSHHQHRAIVAALKAGDPDWAESAMRQHMFAGRAIMMRERTGPSKPHLVYKN